MQHWIWTVCLLVFSGGLNVVGVTLLKSAATNGGLIAAVLGCLAWAGTSAVFLALLETKHELAVLAVLSSTVGFLAVIVIGVFVFGETLTARQLIAIGVLIFGMALLSLPSGT